MFAGLLLFFIYFANKNQRHLILICFYISECEKQKCIIHSQEFIFDLTNGQEFCKRIWISLT